MVNLQWRKCGDDGHWCSLQDLILTSISLTGVYMIWHTGNPSRVVRVGQGDIAQRLSEHRNNPEILFYKKFGSLKVTWAAVPYHQLDGVEKYLADKWRPLVGDAFPIAPPIAVNSPW